MSLKDYNQKRNFYKTPEPKGTEAKGKGLLRFVIQLHHASRLHYDFRIEAGGVFKSWAVPKGPSLDPIQQHLAVQVEDHPLAYGDFEGTIPKGNYGAGTVMIWDEGTYIERHSEGREDSEKAVLDGLEKRHITLILEGKKLQGEFALVGLKENKSWLLIKKRDQFASRKEIPNGNLSAKTGRTLQEIALQAKAKGDIWLPKREPHQKKTSTPPPPPGIPLKPKPSPRSEKLPRKNKPMLATPWPEPFEQKGWIFEIEYGGHRAIAELDKGSVHLYSRQLLPFETKFPDIIEALRTSLVTAVLDGEVINNEFWVRDLLHLNGMNLRTLPLLERKKKLSELPIFNSKVHLSEHSTRCAELFEKAKTEEFPTILARSSYSSYHEGTSKEWLKIPTTDQPTEQKLRLTHLDKILWPKERITKGDLIDYYRKLAPILLPHLKDRPQSMHRHPEGIEVPGFFHKDLTEHHPRWVQTERIFSESTRKSINYVLCQNENTLLYMANLGCIELNPWLSRVGSLSHPDAIVIDLDPDLSNPFSEVVEIAQEIHRILDSVEAPHLCKTSGSTGLHIYIPTQARYNYMTSRNFALAICKVIYSLFPKTTSLDRNPSKRRGRIYLDCFQNAEGQTVAAPYSVRPRPGAPVSTPLKWKELNKHLNPQDFTIHTVPKRLEKLGDLWQFKKAVNIDDCLSSLGKNFPIIY